MHCSRQSRNYKLHIKYIKFSEATTDLNRVCIALTSLKLVECNMDFGNSLIHQFAKLEEADLLGCMNFPVGMVDGFINMNASLTKLSIVGKDCFFGSTGYSIDKQKS